MLSADFLDRTIPAEMARCAVPGMSFALVHRNKIAFSRGYGVATLGSAVEVDCDTVFGIGSCSKSFTSLAMGQLVEANKLAWSDRVADLLPSFRLSDRHVAQSITICDCLAHQCEFEPNSLLFVQSPYDRASLLARIGKLKIISGLRSRFSYQNALYVIAGALIENATRNPWEKVIEENVLLKAGMHRTYASIDGLKDLDNVASPHDQIAGEWKPVEFLDLTASAAAGAINASANDMARWLLLHLQGGSMEDRKVIDGEILNQVLTPQSVVPYEGLNKLIYPNARLLSYAMGWEVLHYGGDELHSHAGNTFGMSAHMVFSKSLESGIVALCNRNASFLPRAVCFSLIDQIVQTKERLDWFESMRKVDEIVQQFPSSLEANDESIRRPCLVPTICPEELEGEYVDDVFGPMLVRIINGELVAEFHDWTFRLEHWHRNVYRAADTLQRVKPKFLIQFRTGLNGQVVGLDTGLIGGSRLSKKKSNQAADGVDHIKEYMEIAGP